MRLTFFIHLNATKMWLSLSHQEREQFVALEVAPLLRESPSLSVRFYDAEFFGAACSDILQIEVEALEDYTRFWDKMRDSKVYTVPYFEVVGIYPAKLSSVLEGRA